MSNKTEKIKLLSKEYRNYTAENLSKLVKIKSLSCHEEEVQKEVVRQMTEAGFDEVSIDGLGNVIGRIGTGNKILAFDGHVDTVDTGNIANWEIEPFSGKIDKDFVYGRGSVDQEGGIAAFITAGRILKEINYDRDISLLFVSSVMEEDCDGLCWKYIIEEENIKPKLVISTEPTNLNIYRGHRGRMEMHVHFNGVSSHGSAPENGKNAIYMASKVCLEIEKLNKNLAVDDFLGKGSITISEIVSGSPSLCAVSDYARIHLDRRLTWGETKESAVNEIEKLISGLDASVEVLNYKETAYTGLEYGMEKYYPTWKLENNNKLVTQAVSIFKALFNKEPKVDKWTFSTNGVTINGIHKIPVIGFGPGNEVMAHSPNEKTPIEQLEKASAFYAMLAESVSL